MQLTGSEILVECLKEQGVDTVFGYPGGAILNIYDALYKHSGEIRHILTSHEQGAAHAADGYARATGNSCSGSLKRRIPYRRYYVRRMHTGRNRTDGRPDRRTDPVRQNFHRNSREPGCFCSNKWENRKEA